MKNAIKHFLTITRHRHEVIKHCSKVGLLWQGLFHDLSKYSIAEFSSGAKYYSDGKKSPNEKERLEEGYSKAWLHHKGRNRHHFEYWNDYNHETKQLQPVKMPLKYVIEMFCDRVAASKIYQKQNYCDTQPMEYFIKVKGKRFIHDETSDLLESWLSCLSKKGENATFKYIKNYYKKNKTY